MSKNKNTNTNNMKWLALLPLAAVFFYGIVTGSVDYTQGLDAVIDITVITLTLLDGNPPH
jgi:hypothetical protein